MEVTYSQVGDYLIPNLVMDEQPKGEIGVWGMRRKAFLKEHHKGAYNLMLLKGTLTQHLIDTNEEALNQMEQITKHLKQVEGVTEKLKATDQMEWVRRMNNIRNRAEEMVWNELIYV